MPCQSLHARRRPAQSIRRRPSPTTASSTTHPYPHVRTPDDGRQGAGRGRYGRDSRTRGCRRWSGEPMRNPDDDAGQCRMRRLWKRTAGRTIRSDYDETRRTHVQTSSRTLASRHPRPLRHRRQCANQNFAWFWATRPSTARVLRFDLTQDDRPKWLWRWWQAQRPP